MGIRNLISLIEKKFPVSTQESWDNSGWQIKLSKEHRHFLTTLSVSDEVVEEAIQHNCDTIISHHPLFFKPVKRIDTTSFPGSIISNLIQNNISLYSMHTPIDHAHDGIAYQWAQKLSLQNISPITADTDFFKISVYTPSSILSQLRQTLLSELSLDSYISSQYNSVSYSSIGTGSFYPSKNANPYSGEKEQLNIVEEQCLEFIIHKSMRSHAVNLIKKLHPYEEPAFAITPAGNLNINPSTGSGRRGRLLNPLSLKDFLSLLQKHGLNKCEVGGAIFDSYKTVFILPGSGKSSLGKATPGSIFVSSDLGYHDAELAKRKGFTVINTSHHEIEFVFHDIIGSLGDRIKNCTIQRSLEDKDYYLN